MGNAVNKIDANTLMDVFEIMDFGWDIIVKADDVQDEEFRQTGNDLHRLGDEILLRAMDFLGLTEGQKREVLDSMGDGSTAEQAVTDAMEG